MRSSACVGECSSGLTAQHYLVTHCWATPEVVQRKTDKVTLTRFMFRFKWLEAQGQPWWYDLATRMPTILADRAFEANEAFEQSRHSIPWSLTDEGIAEMTALTQSYAASGSAMMMDAEPLGEHTCVVCSVVSPIVFTLGPLCLNETCTQYGKVRMSHGRLT